MFDNLKNQITKENLNKIRKNNRYSSDQQNNSQQDQLDRIQIDERIEKFNKLVDNQSDSQPKDQNFTIIQNKYSKTQPKINYVRQYFLAMEKIKILQNNNLKEISMIEENHKRRQLILNLDIDKLKLENNRLSRQEGLIKSLRKDIQKLTDINQILQQRIDNLKSSLLQEKQSHQELKNKIREKKNNLTTEEFKQEINSLNLKIISLQSQIELQEEKRKQLQIKNKEVNYQINNLTNDLNQIQIKFKSQIQQTKRKYQDHISKLQTINIQLIRRNGSLQQTLIGHVSQATQFLYQKKSMQNTTLNLNQQSSLHSNRKIKKHQYQREDPQDELKNEKYYQKRIQILQNNLQKANTIIFKLLKWNRTNNNNKTF